MRTTARTEAVAVLAESGIKERLQHLQQRLLDQAIRHRRDAELALAAVSGSSPVAPASAGTFPPEPVRGCQATTCADEPRSPRWTDRPHQPRPCWPSPVSRLFAGSRAPGPLPAAPALCSARHSAGRSLHRCPVQTGLHPVSPRTAPLSRASDAWLPASLCLKHSSSFGPSPRIRLLRPLLTSRSGSTPSPFQAQGEISPGKNAFLHRTTAGSTPPPLGHESFAVHGPLALVGTASYPVLVHRHAVYAPRFLPTLGHPHAVALHFTRCDQLVAGLPPAGMRPCRAHHRKRPRPGWRGLLFCSLLWRSA